MDFQATLPRSHQVAELLGAQIASGGLAAGSRLASIRALAEEFAVSNQIVISAFDILEGKGLIERRHGSGTYIRAAAQKQDLQSFGLLTAFSESDIDGYFAAAHDAVQSQGKLLVSVLYRWNLDWQTPLKLALARGLKALFVDIEMWDELPGLRELAGDTPVCFLHRWHCAKPAPAPAVLVDFTGINRQVLSFLLARGHRRIAVSGAYNDAGKRANYHNLRQAARALGLDFPSFELPYCPLPWLRKYPEKVVELFSGPDAPTALLEASDYQAHLFLEGLQSLLPSLRLPETVGGYDTVWSRLPGREFHSFRIDYRQLWRQAVELMGGDMPGREVFWLSPEFVQR